MEYITPQYEQQLQDLAQELVTPTRFKLELVDKALAEVVELDLSEAV